RGRARHGSVLRRVVDDVDPLVCTVELVGGRADLGVTTEEGEAGLAVVGEVAAIAGRAAGSVAALVLEARVVGLRLRDRASGRLPDVLRVRRRERLDEGRRGERLAAVGRLGDRGGVRLLLRAEL